MVSNAGQCLRPVEVTCICQCVCVTLAKTRPPSLLPRSVQCGQFSLGLTGEIFEPVIICHQNVRGFSRPQSLTLLSGVQWSHLRCPS